MISRNDHHRLLTCKLIPARRRRRRRRRRTWWDFSKHIHVVIPCLVTSCPKPLVLFRKNHLRLLADNTITICGRMIRRIITNGQIQIWRSDSESEPSQCWPLPLPLSLPLDFPLEDLPPFSSPLSLPPIPSGGGCAGS